MNTVKTFLNLTPEECLEVYLEVEKNANEFFSAAKILADRGIYGKAISLLILGAEEYIKCFLLFLDGHRFNLRNVEKVNTIFRNHRNRHSILRDTYSVWIGVKHFFSLSSKSTSKDVLDAFLNTGLGIFSAFSNYDWWKEADKLKQNGLYVDYHDVLLRPLALTKEDYETALRRIEPIPKDVEEFIARINKMSPKKLEEFRLSFKETDLERLITEAIERKS